MYEVDALALLTVAVADADVDAVGVAALSVERPPSLPVTSAGACRSRIFRMLDSPLHSHRVSTAMLRLLLLSYILNLNYSSVFAMIL